MSLKKFGGQIPKFARANFGNWLPIFFKDLNQKSASQNKGFFYSKAILKVSLKNIEKWLSYNEFVGFH